MTALSKPDVRRGMLLMAVFAVLWAVIEAIAAPTLQRISPLQVVWTRYAVHIALAFALWGWREPARLWRTGRPGFQLARSMMMLIMPGSWAIGLQLQSDMHTFMAIFWTSPLLVVALATAFLDERPSWLVWAAAVAGCAGALVLHPPGQMQGLAMLALPVAMALSFSLYVVMTRSLRTEDVRANLFYTAFGVLIALTPVMPMVWVAPAPTDLAVMIAVGLIGFFALYAVDRAAAAAPISGSAPFLYLQLIVFAGVGIAMGAGVLSSPRRAALGLALIAAAAVFLLARAAPADLQRTGGASRPQTSSRSQ